MRRFFVMWIAFLISVSVNICSAYVYDNILVLMVVVAIVRISICLALMSENIILRTIKLQVISLLLEAKKQFQKVGE